MAFADTVSDPSINKDNCTDDWRIWTRCPNLKYDDSRSSMRGERYVCAECGRSEFFNYDDIDG